MSVIDGAGRLRKNRLKPRAIIPLSNWNKSREFIVTHQAPANWGHYFHARR